MRPEETEKRVEGRKPKRKYTLEQKLRIKEYLKAYNIKNIEKLRAYRRSYAAKNKEKIKKYHNDWWKENYPKKGFREQRILAAKSWYEKNIDKVKIYDRERNKKLYENLYFQNTISWIGTIPEKTNCELCGKEIFLISQDKLTKIYFDHRNEGKEVIKKSPSSWLAKNRCNQKNIKIWKSCDFGHLCCKCNLVLPTKNRKDFFTKAIKYVMGKELNGNL